MKFTKMHGAGNDFVLINNIEERLAPEDFPALARRLCAFHTAIGADGMMVVVPPKAGGDYGMLFFNSDGSLGEMCGNGARCIARFGHDQGLAGDTQKIETTAGLVIGKRLSRSRYQVRLNDPSLLEAQRPVNLDGRLWDCGYVELGSPGIPHAILLLEDWESWDQNELRLLGSRLRYAPEFPKGANVSFVRRTGKNEARAITFERGVEDFTLACGTGCGSIASILHRRGLSDGPVSITMPGGLLEVELTMEGESAKNILLSGPTCLVCTGEISDEI